MQGITLRQVIVGVYILLFKIRHLTRYHYSNSVRLNPQQLRFRPRENCIQQLVDYQIHISPQPLGMHDFLDLEGNWVNQVWFQEATERFEIEVTMQVKTERTNLFNFILAEEALTLPIDHDNDSICARAYLERIETDDSVTAFAAGLSLATNRNPLQFLDKLNRQLFNDFTHVHRNSGKPQSPAVTLRSRQGACRDLAVLFVDCCRAEGIASRFASGYQKGNLSSDRRDLHAWPEVYLPGAGWIGYDPTHGEPVSDTHIIIAAAAHSRDTMPVIGNFVGAGVRSSLNFEVQIAVEEE